MTILDLSCFDDLDELGSEITDPLEQLEQDNYHRLITPPGQNIDDPNFGLGLTRLVSGSSSDIASLGPRIEAELRKDPRNAEVSALVTELERGVYDIQIRIVPDAAALGTTDRELLMRLVGKTDGTVELL
ncbi:MAG: hypothetical protein QOG85_25 [Gaiellaceae bacterium]|jgi:hypothetical protein|nr:hypothetical protein [Gaiellaceae bacterium]